VAFDLPGLGLADRPVGFDYSWTGLGTFARAAVEALGLARCHLVVHDIGGPVGFEVAAALPDRIQCITILNTLIDADTFHRPWVMEPFAIPGVGRVWLGSMVKPLFRRLMFLQGIEDRSCITRDELDAWLELLKSADGGAAFLKIMRGFERTVEKRHLYRSAVRGVPYPVQIVWGSKDPALTLARYGEQAKAAASLSDLHTVPGKHFLQEDQAPAIADHIATLTLSAAS
jgi:pimeloyl-ACP methyl ester carboxylesterase